MKLYNGYKVKAIFSILRKMYSIQLLKKFPETLVEYQSHKYMNQNYDDFLLCNTNYQVFNAVLRVQGISSQTGESNLAFR